MSYYSPEVLLPAQVEKKLKEALEYKTPEQFALWIADDRNYQMRERYEQEQKKQKRVYERKNNVKPAEVRWQTKIKPSKKNDCILWRGKLNKYGKGTFYAHGKTYDHQDYAWWLEHGKLPPTALKITCGTPGCVNVEHLIPTEIRVRRRKQQALQAEDVVEIRRRYDEGESVIDIKEDYRGVSEQSIRNAAMRKSYQWVPETEDDA